MCCVKLGMMARKYEMSRRAMQVEQTRLRITEAAVELHGSIGPARTTISAVAERAGVDRVTVYRHFPDDRALLAACSRHWRVLNPPPDPARWAAVSEPPARVTQALADLYGWFRSTHPMLENVIRDRPFVPALEVLAADREAFGELMVRVLLRGWGVPRGRRPILAAAIAHAIDPTTWVSLTRKGLDDRAAVELMSTFVGAAARSPRS